MINFLFLVCGALAGAAVVWAVTAARRKTELARLSFELESERAAAASVKGQNASLTASNEKISMELRGAREERVRAEAGLDAEQKRSGELSAKNVSLEEELRSLQRAVSAGQSEKTAAETALAESLKKNEEQRKFIAESSGLMKNMFAAVSAESLKSNSQSFLELAKTVLEKHAESARGDLDKRREAIDSMVKPLAENLTKLETGMQGIEKARQGAYSEIKVLLDVMKVSNEKLQKETNTLASSLKASHVRGRYGEIQLRKIAEFAGMSEYCDFEEQVSVSAEDGRLRPDMIVKLPGDRTIIVDAKVPLSSYIQAFENSDGDTQKQFLEKHAKAVRDHLKKLGAKEYWKEFPSSPDYVILYMPIESSFGAALSADGDLIADGLKNNVIFATPTTLITLLKTVACSWDHVKMTRDVQKIRDAGVELYRRSVTLLEHISKLGGNIEAAAKNYNLMVGSLEARFIPQARELRSLNPSVMSKEPPEISQTTSVPRQLQPAPSEGFEKGISEPAKHQTHGE
jgi:DNA recombination protein RmuC